MTLLRWIGWACAAGLAHGVPPSGANDTSVTAWMVYALKAAERAGISVDPRAFLGASSWIDRATDSASGRTGYDSTGSISARVTGINNQFPPMKGEAMTAAALWCRFLLGQTREEADIMTKSADLIRKTT